MVINELNGGDWYQTHPGGNTTDAAAPSRIPTVTRPDARVAAGGIQATGDGVVRCGFGGNFASKGLLLIPYGIGAGSAITVTIIGWAGTNIAPPSKLALWIPNVLGTFTATMGTAAGVANSDLGTTTLFPTTITMTGGPAFVTAGAAAITPDWFQISPGTNLIGMICQRTFGFPFIEVSLATNGTSANCLVRRI